MKIYFVSPIIYGKKNAEFTHTIELYRNLKKIGNRIFLFIFKNAEYIENEDDIVYVPTVNKKILWAILGQITLFFSLFNHKIKYGVPDVIYTRITRITFIPLFVSKLFNIPYVIEVNGLIIDELQIRKKPRFQIWLAKKLLDFNYMHSDKIVAVTKGIKREICKTGKISENKITIVENGVNTDLFKPHNQKETRNTLGLEDKFWYICFVGNLQPWQGIEYIIESSPAIIEEISNVKFLIVGDGPIKKDIVNLTVKNDVSDSFIFTGPVPYEMVAKYINASDICVAPFITERNQKIGLSPLKIYEYAACGKPIIASKIPNLEFIEENNAGILVKPNDSEEITTSIIKLLKNPKLKFEMGKNGRRYVIRGHSWEVISKQVEEVCVELINKHKQK